MADNAEEAKNEQKSKGRPRIHLLDELRGIAVFCMIFYHAFYAMGMIFQFQLGADLIQFFSPAEPFFAGLERGCKLFFLAYAVTLVTFFAVGPDEVIQFGILHMLSISMIAYGLLTKINAKIPMWLGMTIHIILFVVTFTIAGGYIGIPFLLRSALRMVQYRIFLLSRTARQGLYFIRLFSADAVAFPVFCGRFFRQTDPCQKISEICVQKTSFLFCLFRQTFPHYLPHTPACYFCHSGACSAHSRRKMTGCLKGVAHQWKKIKTIPLPPMKKAVKTTAATKKALACTASV